MVSLLALFTTLGIDTYEGRYLVTYDVPGAYIHPEIPQDKHVILELKGYF